MGKIIVLMFFISVVFSSCMVIGMKPYKQFKYAKKHKPFDAIIVPGIPFDAPAPWKFYMKKRVLWSVYLYKKGYTKHIIYSGGAVYTPYPEALVMGRYAQQLGVPDTAILYDTIAQHSVENVYYAYALAKEKGFAHIALATDQVQTYFLSRFLKRFHNRIYKLPALNRYVYTFEHEYPHIDTACIRVQNFIPLPEKITRKERRERSMGSRIDTLFLVNGDMPSL